jgi:hypothetical protein
MIGALRTVEGRSLGISPQAVQRARQTGIKHSLLVVNSEQRDIAWTENSEVRASHEHVGGDC